MNIRGTMGGSTWGGLGRRRRSGGAQPPSYRSLSPAARTASWLHSLLPNTIDRYVLIAFLKNYVLSFCVLVGMYCVLDMVFNFDEFVEVTGHRGVDDIASAFNVFWTIVSFYLFQSFRIFSYLAGIIPVVAAAFTLMRMSRFNELGALLAAGVPLLRVAQPIIIASLLMNLVLLPLNQELLVPNLLPQITRERGTNASVGSGEPIQAMPDGEDARVFAGNYLPGTSDRPTTLQVVDILRGNGSEIALIQADIATWDADALHWTLTNGTITSFFADGAGGRRSQPLASFSGTTTPESITLFRSRNQFVDLLSTSRINELLTQRNPVGRIDLLRVRDARLAGFVLNIILVLLTIPCVLTREPMQLKTSTMRVFFLVGSAMAMIFVTQNLAGRPPEDAFWATKWSAVMAWVPIFIYGPIAVWMLDRIKT